ncbi:NADH dehydrogenase [ubiquinone] 1 beta subcomplex subunit 8, mitochondrial [Eurytemora carolleeae]|uniref:NADH dehydrogenase [ubiquinone] 1 beta subcomplex subunit 8, mitochondrial n=1 Tax=Eurytemora carolleeae TaxID=1294199 RepID=UPI000C77EA3B|nr:NADH dehydrogenase [ubiquinone] 1 beta subcomplex subunit 8, mitochondrial [Eurytemora carolleeae]|eukprot:XP_023330746.1 NADH dehydrogenase [ubiquinone] 1 beta subcomplex subunit 8, mitochondrial-like [Eurytemora affinis]
MAGVVRLRTLVQGKANFHTMSVVRAAGSPPPWNYLWKPGPYPESEDAKMKAAKKYGLLYEDYQPYPKGSDMLCGDYPNLPLVPEAYRSSTYEWDYPEYKRDYGETPHVEWDKYRETRYTPPQNPILSIPYMLSCFFAVVGGLTLAIYYSYDNPWLPQMQQPRTAKQLYNPGVTYYTMEELE